MNYLTAQQKAKIYATSYIDHYNLKDYFDATKKHKLSQDEAEVVWESIDKYEDMRPQGRIDNGKT